MTTDRRNLFDVSWRAIAKVLVAAALVWAWFQLWQFVMVMVVVDHHGDRARSSRPMARANAACRDAWASVVRHAAGCAVLMAMIAASWVSITGSVAVHRSTTSPSSLAQLRASFPTLERVLPGGEGEERPWARTRCRSARSAATAIGMFVLALVLDGVPADRVEANARVDDGVRAAGPSAEGAAHARRGARHGLQLRRGQCA